jgi:hypothetical protein
MQNLRRLIPLKLHHPVFTLTKINQVFAKESQMYT